MRGAFTQLYVHIIWATWDRLPLITETIRPRLYGAIAKKARAMKCDPLAIGGTADHVHLLVRLHPTVPIAELVRQIKGATSHLITHEICPGGFFRWQGAYSAFTLRQSEVPSLRAYIRRQEEHHASGTTDKEWEVLPKRQDGIKAAAEGRLGNP
mgnify:CR=1 FL=1